MEFGKKLQNLRDQAGLSQAELARASGVPVWTLRGYEQGRREPLWQVLFKLADALGVSVEVFRDCVANGEPAPLPRGRPKKPAPAEAPAGKNRGRKRKGG